MSWHCWIMTFVAGMYMESIVTNPYPLKLIPFALFFGASLVLKTHEKLGGE